MIGTETLSRVIDQYDRDSMIFIDDAGALLLEYRDTSANGQGISSMSMETHAQEEADYIGLVSSCCPHADSQV